VIGQPHDRQNQENTMTDMQAHTHEVCELTDAQLDAVTGGEKAETQIFQALSSAVSEVMKNFGAALSNAARAG
jgi:hypothetical protein